MKRLRRIILTMIGCGLLVGPLLPAPVDAATPLTINCADPFGAQITEPGRYMLTKSVDNCASGTGIVIFADNVDLDLRGFLFRGNGAGSNGITIAGGSNGVTVRNGAVGNYPSCAAAGGDRGTISNLVVRSCSLVGISLNGIGNVASGNTISQSGTGVLVGADNTARRNTIYGSLGAGIRMGGNNGQAISNTITGGLIDGIATQSLPTGLEIIGNTIRLVAERGIWIPEGDSVVRGNRVEASGFHGIEVGDSMDSGSGNNSVIGNTTLRNGLSGIQSAGDGNTVSRNVSRFNIQDGLRTLGNGTVSRNIATDNGEAGIHDSSDSSVISRNVAHRNHGDGIQTNNDALTISRNTTSGNRLFGISSGGSATFIRNRARGNAGAPPECAPVEACN